MSYRLLFLLYAAIVTVLPALGVLVHNGAMAPFWLLAGDAYLYLGIGRASDGLGFSFDGERPTNGFHPLWQVWVRLMAVLSLGSPLVHMHLVAWSAVALTLAGVLALGLAIARLTGSWLLASLAVPGVYYLTVGQGLSNNPVWGFFDGMEAGLAFAVSGLIALALASAGEERGEARFWLRLGLLLALLVLTRLDEVFVVSGIVLGTLLWRGVPVSRRLRNALLVALPTTLALAIYLGWNLRVMGILMPISGAAKGEGALIGNLWVTAATFFAPLIDLRAALTTYEPAHAALLGGAFRVVQLVVPALMAALFIAVIRRHFRTEPWAPLLAGLSLGILGKALYSLVLVNYWHQAGWYFALAMMTVTLGTALIVAPGYHALVSRAGWARPVLGALLVGFTLLHASLWTNRLLTSPWQPEQRDFWLDRAATEAALRAAEPDIRLLEFGDGVLNFSFGFAVRHGFVFAGDPGSLVALREGRLLAASAADGYRVLSSFEYLRVPEGAEDWDSARIRTFLQGSFLDHRVKAELDGFDFEMIHVARPAGVPFIRFTPRP